MDETKTMIRKKLEYIENEIHLSWLRDMDKTRDMQELIEILDIILRADSLEEFFRNNASDVEYFTKKFIKEVSFNILRQNFVFGQNGDDIALEVLTYFLKLFLKYMDKQQYVAMLEYIREIFDSSKSYYKVSFFGNVRILNQKKIQSADKYNESLPRKKEKFHEFQIGDIIDVLIENKKSHNLGDKRVWIRGIVEKIVENKYSVNIGEEGAQVFASTSSMDVALKGTFTKDYEWRTNLKQWDVIDCFDRGRWFPATILNLKEETYNGIRNVSYRIGFRLYADKFEDWKNFQKYWNDRSFSMDNMGRKYIGDAEGMDEWISFYSKRIQQFNTYISDPLSNNTKTVSDDFDPFFMDDIIPFEHEGKKNYIIGRGNNFSYYYALILKNFAEIGGFEKLAENMCKVKLNGELIHTIYYIFSCAFSYLHKDYINLVAEKITQSAFAFIKDLNSTELRNIKKDTIEMIIKVLKIYLSVSKDPVEKNRIIENFSISSSLRMIKTTFLDKRIQAIKNLVDVIKSHKNDKEKTQEILKMIEENQLFYEIYGPNTHIQLINKSKELLEIMLQEDKMSNGELEIIWAATKKGDLEGKLTILKTLKEISSSLRKKHIEILLDNAYSEKTSGEDLIIEEIELIYELSTNIKLDEDNMNAEEIQKFKYTQVERCINYFTQSLLNSKSEEGSKINALIAKIYDITTLYPTFKRNVIDMCIDSLNKNQNAVLSFKILSRYLSDPFLRSSNFSLEKLDKETKLLLKNDYIVKLFYENFKAYKNCAREIVNKLNLYENAEDLIMYDNFSHSQHIKIRLDFVQLLQSLSIFSKNDFIQFVYDILIEDSVTHFDKKEFYNYIQKVLENKADSLTEERIYKIYEEKICKDTKSCQDLSIQAFESFLKIFLDVNSQNLQFSSSASGKESKISIKSFTDPEKLTGFHILWRIVFESFSNDIMNKGIEFLHNLYANTNISENDINQIEEKVAQQNNQDQIGTTRQKNYSEILLKKCLQLISDVVNNTNDLSIGETENIIKKCLFFLKLIIEESEKKGTARIKSHSGLLKNKVINLKVDSHISNKPDFNIKVYANTTMWELKELVSKNSGVGIDFLNVMLKSRDINPTENGKTVLELGMADGDEIRIFMNSANNYIPQSDLTRNGKCVPELIKIFNSWFDTFSTDGKQYKEDLSRFIKTVTNTKENISTDDSRISGLFSQYDREGKGWLDRDSFLSFYIDCSVKPERRRIVWENLHSMGIRNDLKSYDEPLEVFNTDKTILPRYQLSHNETFFNILFYLQDLHESIANEAFDFLCTITTNPVIYKQILNWGIEELNTNVNDLFHNENIFKLIYSLQIIESFIEDIEIESVGVDTFTNEESILGLTDVSLEKVREIKIEWMKRFVNAGGFKELVSILNAKLSEKNFNSIKTINKKCLDLLIKITRIFFNSSLNQFEVYRGFNANNNLSELFQNELGGKILESFDFISLSDNLINLVINTTEAENKNLTTEDINIIENSFEFLIGIVTFSPKYNFELQDLILKQRNMELVKIYNFGIISKIPSIREKFASTLLKFCKISQSLNNLSLITFFFSNNFAIFDNLIHLEESEKNEKIKKNIIVSEEREEDKENYLNFYDFQEKENEEKQEVTTNETEIKSVSTEFFEIFSVLFEIYLTDMTLMSVDKGLVDPENFIMRLAENLYYDLKPDQEEPEVAEDVEDDENQKENENENNFNQNFEEKCKVSGEIKARIINEHENKINRKPLSNEVFVGHLKILTKVVDKLPEMKQQINARFNLIKLILIRILFKQNSKEMNEKISKMEFINPDKIDENKNSRNTNIECRNACYSFILAMLKNSLENFENFFSTNILENEQEEEETLPSPPNVGNTPAQQMRAYRQTSISKREGHVGLYNLGCICYMNSMMQQFFMVPSFRYLLLQQSDNIAPSRDNHLNVDDNVLHQVQRMFTFLDMSEREDYNPAGFCFSFKDWDGNPTNTSIQQDSQEFLGRFLEKIETALKPTPNKYILQSIFGGKTCSQLICEEGCGNVKNRFEDFYNLSLEVANMKTLNDSLEKFIFPEKIDSYDCETCQKKVTITKRNSLAELPNVLIVHLQRIYFNYEHERDEKINSRLEFPKVLNLKNYCIEELMRKNKAKKGANSSEEAEVVNELYETDDIYFKKNEYYEYHLVGVNVHIGSAHSGHYFSFINTVRNGSDDELLYDPNNETHTNSWLKFNDSHISKFNVNKLEEECFGGSSGNDDRGSWHRMMDNSQSAYLLIYERRVKTPIKMISSEPLDKSNLISFKEEEYSLIKKQYDLYRLNTGASPNLPITTSKKLSELTFYDSAKNEYFKYKRFFSIERLIPRDFYVEVTGDNSLFQKHKNILDQQFVNFFENIITVLDETISDMKEIKSDTSNRICNTLLTFIFKVLNTKGKQKLLRPAVEKYIAIIENNPDCLLISFDFILDNKKLVLDALFNDDVFIVKTNATMLNKLIEIGYSYDPTIFRECVVELNEHSISGKTIKLCDFLLELFPRIQSKYVNKIYPLYEVNN